MERRLEWTIQRVVQILRRKGRKPVDSDVEIVLQNEVDQIAHGQRQLTAANQIRQLLRGSRRYRTGKCHLRWTIALQKVLYKVSVDFGSRRCSHGQTCEHGDG